MIQVYSALHPTEAHMVKGLLEADGIECVVRGEILFAARGELPLTPDTAPSVWIKEAAQLQAARRVVRLYEDRNNDLPGDGEHWQCESCGEIHEGQFTHCWKCGMPE